jgi:hypothetical protein
MRCRLCLKDAPLQNSHIIPEFHYNPLYDSKHRFFVLSTEKGRRPTEQKGFRERLLCQKCETLLSRWESYAKEVIFDSEAQFVSKHGKHIRLGNIDYHRFKLYLLSLIWRMGVSSLKMFKAVSLGPYEQLLRRRLLAEDPGPSLPLFCYWHFGQWDLST